MTEKFTRMNFFHVFEPKRALVNYILDQECKCYRIHLWYFDLFLQRTTTNVAAKHRIRSAHVHRLQRTNTIHLTILQTTEFLLFSSCISIFLGTKRSLELGRSKPLPWQRNYFVSSPSNAFVPGIPSIEGSRALRVEGFCPIRSVFHHPLFFQDRSFYRQKYMGTAKTTACSLLLVVVLGCITIVAN